MYHTCPRKHYRVCDRRILLHFPVSWSIQGIWSCNLHPAQPSSKAACMLILMPLKSWKNGTMAGFQVPISNTDRSWVLPARSHWWLMVKHVQKSAKRPRFSSSWSLPTSATLEDGTPFSMGIMVKQWKSSEKLTKIGLQVPYESLETSIKPPCFAELFTSRLRCGFQPQSSPSWSFHPWSCRTGMGQFVG